MKHLATRATRAMRALRTLRALGGMLTLMALSGFLPGNGARASLKLGASRVQTAQVSAELIAYAPQGASMGQSPGAAPNTPNTPNARLPGAEPVWVGLKLSHAPHWHTYWKNPGDSGLPTSLEWTVPEGVTVGEIAWPLPRRIDLGDLANYGYEGDVLLAAPLTITPRFKAGMLEREIAISLHASWLVCQTQCIPQEGQFDLKLPIAGSTVIDAPAFETTFAQQPQPIAPPRPIPAIVRGARMELQVQSLPQEARGKNLEVFPETADIFFNAVKPAAANAALQSNTWRQAWHGGVWSADLPLSPQRIAAPATLPLVLVVAGEEPRRGWRVVANVQGAWSAAATGAGTIATLPIQENNGTSALAEEPKKPQEPQEPQEPQNSAQTPKAQVRAALSKSLSTGSVQKLDQGSNQGSAQISSRMSSGGAPQGSGTPWSKFFAALLGAFVGGIVLNLMPCVFPILAMKALSLSRNAGDERAHRLSSIGYGAGVVASFLVLGAIMLILRSAGEQLGWGFQLQSPLVVAALAALFAVIGLNLAGLFEVGRFLPNNVLTLQLRHPLLDSLLAGVLAVAVASPCTAPFMGASLGLAIVLPSALALSLFAAIGLGMALPFMAAGMIPAFARMLPRPGPWMVTLRRLLAFPMFAATVWLVWVLGLQQGIDAAAGVLQILVGLALLLWALTLRGRARGLIATFSIALLAVLVYYFGALLLTAPPASALASSSSSSSRGGQPAQEPGHWQSWTREKMQATLDAGHPVFVDFTAAWCVTCQVNEKTTLSRPDILAKLDAAGVKTFRADWTRRDNAIAHELQELGRSGIPVYLLQAPGKSAQVLSELIEPSDIEAALGRL